MLAKIQKFDNMLCEAREMAPLYIVSEKVKWYKPLKKGTWQILAKM